MAKVGEELFHKQGLTYDTFCAGCGYNLRTRPRVGRCPECGNEYDSRPLHLKGLLGMDQPESPFMAFRDLLLALLSVALFVALALNGRLWAYIVAAVFFGAAIWYGREFVRRFVRWWRYSALIRRARREQNRGRE